MINLNIIAQDKIYVSEKYGNTLKLIFKSDGTYQLIYNEGSYEQKLDSIYLNSKAVTKDNFTAIPVDIVGNTDSLELSFINDAGYISTYNIAIAASSGDDSNLNFYPLYYYQTNSMDSYTDNLFEVTIKKERYLYVAKKDYVTNETVVSKFEIPNNVNALQISENYTILTNLVAVTNEKGNIVVSENGANPFEFVLQEKLATQEKPKGLDYTPINNIAIDWSFASLYNPNNGYTVPGSDTIKVVVEASLKDALKNLKANAQTCLIIVNEPKEDFEKLITLHKASVVDLGYYDESDKNIFNFSFYNLKDDEINWLEKKNLSKNTKLAVFNTNETLIFNSEESTNIFTVAGYYSYEYITLARQIKSIATLSLVNDVLSSKNNSIPQLKTALYNAGVKINYRILFPEEPDYSTNSEAVATNAYDSLSYPAPAKLNGKFYKSKISKQDLDVLWSKVLNHYEKEAGYDKELFHTIYKELNNEGFSMNLLGEQRFILNESDFKAFNYLLKHYQAIGAENNNTEYNYDYTTYFPSTADVKYLITNVLSRNLLEGYPEVASMEQKKKIIKDYGEYIYNSPNDYYLLSNYVTTLAAIRNDKEFFGFYEVFISRFDTKNIIESLNNYYENNYDLNWQDLKSNFSTMANNVSWYVVENKIKDADRIKKAIEWSEMSLKLSRNNSYYMDTLAQLYYMDGSKQKAIETQEKAIENYKDADVNPDTLNEMKSVLEKMKIGNYE
jgi:hypothetical protein